MAEKKTVKEPEAVEQPKAKKEVKAVPKEKERLANGFPISEIISRVRRVCGTEQGINLPPQQTLVLILGWNWRFEWSREEETGTLILIDDEQAELCRYSYPGDYCEALQGCFCMTFGFAFPKKTGGGQVVAKRSDPMPVMVEEDEDAFVIESPEIVDDVLNVPFLDDDTSILSDATVKGKPAPAPKGKVQNGNYKSGYYNDLDALPDRFSARVKLLTDMEQRPKTGAPKGYAAMVSCKGRRVEMRFWLNNHEGKINTNYLASLRKGSEFAGVFTKVVEESGNVQLCLQGFANAVG